MLVGVPEDILISCCVPVRDPPEVTAEDVCDESVEVAFAEETVEEGGNIAVIRTWTATDAYGETVH